MSEINTESSHTKKNLKTPEGINSIVILKNKSKSRQESKKHAKQVKRLRIMGKLPFCHTHELQK
jgi:hypothetical protein